jgi:hypothetical protein
VQLVVNTPLGAKSHYDERAIRRAAVRHQVFCITTLEGALAAVSGIEALQKQKVEIHCLQDLYPKAVARKPQAAKKAARPQEARAHLASPPEPRK